MIATYTYNALDQRIGVQEGGSRTWTVYNGTSADADPYADFNGSGTLLTRYLYGPGVVNGAVVDEILARTSSGGTTAWYLPDKQGSVRDIVSSSGSLLDHIVYDSFGNILTETNASNGDRFKFAGMEYDSTTGQYYDHAREYESAGGRPSDSHKIQLGFAARDNNLYRYVKNSPTSAIDPNGMDEETDGTGGKLSLQQLELAQREGAISAQQGLVKELQQENAKKQAELDRAREQRQSAIQEALQSTVDHQAASAASLKLYRLVYIIRPN